MTARPTSAAIVLLAASALIGSPLPASGQATDTTRAERAVSQRPTMNRVQAGPTKSVVTGRPAAEGSDDRFGDAAGDSRGPSNVSASPPATGSGAKSKYRGQRRDRDCRSNRASTEKFGDAAPQYDVNCDYSIPR